MWPLVDLLRQRRRALAHEWQLATRAAGAVDDDLLPLRRRLEDGLVAVELAFERLAQGRYGRCTACGAAIDFQRLLALPTAARCWACERTAELATEGDAEPPH